MIVGNDTLQMVRNIVFAGILFITYINQDLPVFEQFTIGANAIKTESAEDVVSVTITSIVPFLIFTK